jgi:hypothetical protein
VLKTSKTQAQTAGVEILSDSCVAALGRKELMDVKAWDDGEKVPACCSEKEEVHGLKFARDLVLDLSWESKEVTGACVSTHHGEVCELPDVWQRLVILATPAVPWCRY